MKQNKLIELLCELVKNSRRSDRDLAKTLNFSQSSVSRLRKVLEKEAMLQYTAIPNFSYLGFDIVAFTFYRMKEPSQYLKEKAEKWMNTQPNVVFSSEGEGMEADTVMISMHSDYGDFSKFQQKFRKEWGVNLVSFKTFLLSFGGHTILKTFTFKDLAPHVMSNLSGIDFQREVLKHHVPSDLLKVGPVLNVREGEESIAMYTSATDKMKIFSTFVRQGLENGDSIEYIYPDEESETVRAEFEKYGIDVEEYEEDGSLYMKSLSEYFMSNGKFDSEKAVMNTLNWWKEAKKKGYNHARNIEDVGDFSFINGQWQKYITDYWQNPKFGPKPKSPNWTEFKERVRVMENPLYSPFLIDITAINVENINKAQIHDILKAFGQGDYPPTRFIDLLEGVDIFSKRIGISHLELLGRKLLLEFDPTSDYETIIEYFAKESMANAEAIHVFTYATSTIHKCLAKYPTIKLFTMSISTSTIQPESENEVSIPANNIDLTLDFISKVTRTYSKTNVSIVFDGLSDLLISLNPERTRTFLRHALQILSSERTTALFLLNTSAHDPKTVSRLRSMFYNQLAYGKDGLQIIKLPKLE